MSSSPPPSFFDVAKQRLMKDEVWAIKALQSVPPFLVPTLMTEVVSSRNTKILQAMVQAWPFPFLPVRACIEDQQVYPDILHAVLDGFDVLLDMTAPPSGCNLKVLNLRQDFFNTSWFLKSSNERQNSQSSLQDPNSGEEKESPSVLKLVTDLCFSDTCGYQVLKFLIRRVKKGKVLPQLCCRKLEIMRNPLTSPVLVKILQNVQLDCVQEVDINHGLKLQDLDSFAPYLGQMVHLNTLQLCGGIKDPSVTQTEHEVHEVYTRFTSQFLHLHQLKHLFLYSVLYLKGHVGQILRYLDTSLETLCITGCSLSLSDVTCLSRCPCTSHLKYLDLNDVVLTDFNPELLRVLLQRVSATLEYLHLGGCRISDSQLAVMLPALSLCSQLQHFDFCGNQVSSVGLENLLRQTLPPNQSRHLLLPVPLDCYRDLQGVHPGRLEQFWAQLTLLFQELGSPSKIRVNYSVFPYDMFELWFDVSCH